MKDLILTKKILKRIERGNKRRKKKDFLKEEFELSVFSKRDTKESVPCLRYEGRIFRDFYNIPSNTILKSVRGADSNWEDATVEHWVMVNHNSDLMFHPFHKENLAIIFPDEKSFADIYYGKNGKHKRTHDLVDMWSGAVYNALPQIDTKSF